MKLKKLSSTLTLALMLTFTFSNLTHASLQKPNVYVNNQKLDIYANVSAVDVTYVPFRPIFDKLNMTVNWDNDKKSVTATNGTTTIILTNDSYTAYVNDKAVKLINPPFYNPDDKLFYVNLRFVAESTGATVNWSKNKTDANIYITNPNLK
ncbi:MULTISPECIES: copper amine oxidase N-terminal domain-containing protein [Paenibacillus]|uniref:copper amine oxidase N-terminal domain-containing protein n=1 Tax=Paenibacillus TaxID=44249 RepID=UPI000375BD5C|nr:MULTISPECIES: copper amine oxidase N-terminal domain-containing protein [Paenibacillus]